MEGAQASPPMPRRRATASALRVGGRGGRRREGPSVSRTRTAAGADLGGSSNYSNETPWKADVGEGSTSTAIARG